MNSITKIFPVSVHVQHINMPLCVHTKDGGVGSINKSSLLSFIGMAQEFLRVFMHHIQADVGNADQFIPLVWLPLLILF